VLDIILISMEHKNYTLNGTYLFWIENSGHIIRRVVSLEGDNVEIFDCHLKSGLMGCVTLSVWFSYNVICNWQRWTSTCCCWKRKSNILKINNWLSSFGKVNQKLTVIWSVQVNILNDRSERQPLLPRRMKLLICRLRKMLACQYHH
jgi:hypothetical protein